MNSADLRRFRSERGWSKTRCAVELGIGRNTYAAYEAGREIPKTVALACAALAFGLPPMGT